MKDKYREETNKDVYPETTIIDCNSNCGSYTNDYVHWLEKQVKALTIPVVVFSEARAEVCKRGEHWKECVTWIYDCRCIKSCDLHK